MCQKLSRFETLQICLFRKLECQQTSNFLLRAMSTYRKLECANIHLPSEVASAICCKDSALVWCVYPAGLHLGPSQLCLVFCNFEEEVFEQSWARRTSAKPTRTKVEHATKFCVLRRLGQFDCLLLFMRSGSSIPIVYK